MIHDRKVFDLEITVFENQHNRKPPGETMPSQSSNP